jgi:hypothetical protein
LRRTMVRTHKYSTTYPGLSITMLYSAEKLTQTFLSIDSAPCKPLSTALREWMTEL